MDSEGLAGLLEKSGHSISQRPEGSDCVVINTCAFIREAEEESIAAILDVAELKKKGKIRRLYVAGCLPQKRRAEQGDLLKLLPEVDGFLGPGDLTKLPELIAASSDRFFVTSPVPTLLFESTVPKHRLTPKHYAYLKISEGCDHACTFCSIPQFRGPHRSRSIEDLVEEARRLASMGVVELNLIGQDTSFYGKDRYGRLALADLLRQLDQVDGIRWIRLLYAHPAHVTEELIAAIRDCRRVVKYIDIPLQHINDDLLSAMRRETDGAWIRRMIRRFREEIPGITLRTTFIAGFPGETEAHAQELAEFLRESRFERVGIFPFSPESKTPAERMPNQVPEEMRQARLNRLMQLQQEIAREIHEGWLGREMDVLVDEEASRARASDHSQSFPRKGESDSRWSLPSRVIEGLPSTPIEGGNDTWYLGRSYADAPEVDGQVFLKSDRPLSPGQFVRARVVDTTEYDLVAEAIPAAAIGSPALRRDFPAQKRSGGRTRRLSAQPLDEPS